MSGYPYRWQAAWLALLGLVWLGLCSPWSIGVNGMLAFGVAGTLVIVVLRLTRWQRARRRMMAQTLAVLDQSLQAMPVAMKRNMPLVIVVGDALALAGAFDDAAVRVTDGAIWVRHRSPATLAVLADALARWRHGQGPDAVALLVAADAGDEATHAPGALRPWHAGMVAASRAVGYDLPVCVAAYAALPADDPHASPWFGVSGSTRLQAGELAGMLAPRFAQHVQFAIPLASHSRVKRAARLDALVRWVAKAWLPHYTHGPDALNMVAFGVKGVSGAPSGQTAFARFLAKTTGLIEPVPDHPAPSRYPLPDALLTGIPRQPVRRAWPGALGHALLGLAIFFVAGAASSAWQNRELLQRVADDVTRYEAITPESAVDAARVDALQRVKHDRDELEHYAQDGVPVRLGFGLYRAAAWLPIEQRLIADYRPPAPPPQMIELDSLPLFSTGRATLNPAANRVLIQALDMIRAHPGKRILIAGHTDSVGRASFNQRLSEARAAAVRDWLADASGIPVTQFAIEGYGDTRPKASNDTAAGRAANRRVEITLIPDCRNAHAVDGSQSSRGKTPCL